MGLSKRFGVVLFLPSQVVDLILLLLKDIPVCKYNMFNNKYKMVTK